MKTTNLLVVMMVVSAALGGCTLQSEDPAHDLGSSSEALADYGTQRDGMHACPLGQFMWGAHFDNNVFECRFTGSTYSVRDETVIGPHPVADPGVGSTTPGLLADQIRYENLASHVPVSCPYGSAMTGYHAGSRLAICAPLFGRRILAFYDDGSQENYDGRNTMHVCSGGFLAGVDAGRNRFLCVQ
jgi:hypothetical protein